jgi:hypothetical protein
MDLLVTDNYSALEQDFQSDVQHPLANIILMLSGICDIRHTRWFNASCGDMFFVEAAYPIETLWPMRVEVSNTRVDESRLRDGSDCGELVSCGESEAR